MENNALDIYDVFVGPNDSEPNLVNFYRSALKNLNDIKQFFFKLRWP